MSLPRLSARQTGNQPAAFLKAHRLGDGKFKFTHTTQKRLIVDRTLFNDDIFERYHKYRGQ